MIQNEITQDLISYLKFPYRVLSTDFTHEQITEYYRQEFVRGQKEGFTPVLIKVDDALAECFGLMEEEGYYPEQALQSLPDGKEVLAQRWQEATGGNWTDDSEKYQELLDSVDAAAGQNAFLTLHLHTPSQMEPTLLFEIPVVNPWEIPAYVPFGGWNDCPSPEEMTAVCKYWFEQYQAVPAVISHDTLEMILPEPVPEEKADEFVKEYYAFCQDTIDQGVPMPLLKETVKYSTVWQFWWD